MTRRRLVRALVVALSVSASLASASSAHAGSTVYVGGGADVAAFSAGSDGALTAVTGSPFTAEDTPAAVALTPDGDHLYTGDSYGYLERRHVSAFSVGAGGALTTVAGSPFEAGNGPAGLAVTPDGRYIYVANYNSEFVSGFSIAADGTLEPVPGPPADISIEGVSETWGNGIAVTPDGHYLYVDGGPHDLWEFSIGADGALTELAGSPLTIGNDPGSIAVTPDGAHLYLADYGSDALSEFTIGLDGALTPRPGSPLKTGLGPAGLALTPDGRWLYLTNYNADTMSAYSVAADGTLSAVPGSPFTVGEYPSAVATSPDDQYLYVTQSGPGSGAVAAFSIGPEGAPSVVPGSPFATPSNPDTVTVAPDQGPVAAFSAGAAEAGSPSSFDGSGSSDPDGTVARYDWSFGDGTSAADAGPSPTHVYAAPGEYTVTLTVADDDGCSTAQTFTGQTVSCNGSAAARASHQVTVPGPPSSTPPPGSSTAEPSPPAPPSPQPTTMPALRGLKVLPASFSVAGRRVGGKCVKATSRNAGKPACARVPKLTIGYRLSAAATVTFAISGRVPGRKLKGRCVATAAASRGHGHCTRALEVHPSIVRAGKAGANRLTLSRKLAPGTYTLTATPAGGAAARARFGIAG